jgi:hypothetical protein
MTAGAIQTAPVRVPHAPSRLLRSPYTPSTLLNSFKKFVDMISAFDEAVADAMYLSEFVQE